MDSLKGDTMIDVDTTCELLDKFILENLRLMERNMKLELAIESAVSDGGYHLAKSRYICGQNAVSATKLPTENSSEFSATILCKTENKSGFHQISVSQRSKEEDTVNPLHWFGLLVPQNLIRAQKIFQNVISLIVECVNVQLQLRENLSSIKVLRNYKKILEPKQTI